MCNSCDPQHERNSAYKSLDTNPADSNSKLGSQWLSMPTLCNANYLILLCGRCIHLCKTMASLHGELSFNFHQQKSVSWHRDILTKLLAESTPVVLRSLLDLDLEFVLIRCE